MPWSLIRNCTAETLSTSRTELTLWWGHDTDNPPPLLVIRAPPRKKSAEIGWQASGSSALNNKRIASDSLQPVSCFPWFMLYFNQHRFKFEKSTPQNNDLFEYTVTKLTSYNVPNWYILLSTYLFPCCHHRFNNVAVFPHLISSLYHWQIWRTVLLGI